MPSIEDAEQPGGAAGEWSALLEARTALRAPSAPFISEWQVERNRLALGFEAADSGGDGGRIEPALLTWTVHVFEGELPCPALPCLRLIHVSLRYFSALPAGYILLLTWTVHVFEGHKFVEAGDEATPPFLVRQVQSQVNKDLCCELLQ